MIRPIAEHKIHGGVSPHAVGDIDGDGDPDVVTGQAWYENMGEGLQWIQHKNIDLGEEHQYGIAIKPWVIDLDGDGDNDVVQAEADNPDSRVAWFENDGSGEWIRHIIKDKGDLQDFHSLVIADFDNDSCSTECECWLRSGQATEFFYDVLAMAANYCHSLATQSILRPLHAPVGDVCRS